MVRDAPDALTASPLIGDLPSDDEWNALADAAGASPFRRPGWIHAWARAFSKSALEAATVWRDGELVAMLPLVRGRFGLSAPVNAHSPDFGPIAIDRDALEELVAGVYASRQPSIELGVLDRASADTFSDMASSHRRSVLQRTIRQAPYIDLGGSFDDYVSTLSRNRRKGIRRQRRRLEKEGTLGFEVHDGTSNLEALLAEVFRVEASGWKGERGTAISSQGVTQRFYSEVARWAADSGWMRIALQRLDGAVISADYAFEYGETWYTLKVGYDDDFRSFGPGALLLWEEIAYCCAHGLRRLDLLGTTDPFKESWTDQAAPRIWLRAFSHGPIGLPMWAGFSAREAVRPLARAVRLRVESRRSRLGA